MGKSNFFWVCAVYICITACTHVANIQLCNIKVPEVGVGAPLPLLNYKTLIGILFSNRKSLQFSYIVPATFSRVLHQ